MTLVQDPVLDENKVQVLDENNELVYVDAEKDLDPVIITRAK